MNNKAELFKLNKEKKRGDKTFTHLKPKKKDKIWELEFNGVLYRNSNKDDLLNDIGTIENGRSS